MPKVLDPPLTTRQVRQHATAALPGARVRRLVFWRYLLLWQRPIEGGLASTGRLSGGERPGRMPAEPPIGAA